MYLDVNDPDYMPVYRRMESALEAAWLAALRLVGCVECAKIELVHRIQGRVDEKKIEIMGGIDWVNDDSASIADAPMEKDGISRLCEKCQAKGTAGL